MRHPTPRDSTTQPPRCADNGHVVAGRDGASGSADQDEHVRPLSSGQYGIALQQQMAEHSPLFNVPAALEIVGPLDRRALAAALTEIIRRHDVLRTRLAYRDAALIQIVEPPRPADLSIQDLRHLPPQQRYPAARALLDGEAARPFDLFREHGLRLMLTVLDDERHILFWAMHHLVCDGWSKSVFARDLSLLYAGRAADLPPLTVTYGDHVAQERAVDPHVLQRQLAYWERQLDGVHELTGVRPDRPRPAAANQHGADLAFTIDAETRQRLAQLARTRGASEFMVLHAAMTALVHRISGQSDIVINIPYGGRPSAGFEALIGFFVNVLALRSRVPADLAFTHLVDQVRGTALDGYDHHLVPFQQVASQMAARHGGRVGPLHQVSFAFANLPYREVDLVGLQVRRFALTRSDIRYELEWHLWQDDGSSGYGGRLVYRSDLFERESAIAFVTAYQQLLTAVAADPSLPVGALTARLELPVARDAAAHAPTTTPSGGAWTSESAQPTTETQTAVQEIWAELLHQEDVGVFDDFFAIGGHSLLVALMAAKIRDVFGVNLSIRRLVQGPTIAEIAAAVDDELHGADQDPSVDGEPADGR